MDRIGMVKVPDDRVTALNDIYQPQKTTHAQVEYFLPGTSEQKDEQGAWNRVKEADALIHVVRNFGGYGDAPPTPLKDGLALDQELIFSDLVIVEKRLERLTLDQKRGKKADPKELALLEACRLDLEAEIPLRRNPALAFARELKGFALLSAKPALMLFNNEDDDDTPPPIEHQTGEAHACIRGKLEQELSQMSAKEAGEFLNEFNITASAMDRIISQSYDMLGLISFFTVGDDEVKAWTLKKNTPAVDAAGVIHTDMQKGFIRAEVLAYQDLKQSGSYHNARKQGLVRLEGKTYPVKDGDIINFRFNV
jgi:ribosome-binding ATPase YchF (GTP1/OBG family)